MELWSIVPGIHSGVALTLNPSRDWFLYFHYWISVDKWPKGSTWQESKVTVAILLWDLLRTSLFASVLCVSVFLTSLEELWLHVWRIYGIWFFSFIRLQCVGLDARLIEFNQNGNGCFHFQDYSVQSICYCCLGIKPPPIRQDLNKCVYNVTHKKESEETYW